MKSHLMVSCWEWPSVFGAETMEKGIDVMVSHSHDNFQIV